MKNILFILTLSVSLLTFAQADKTEAASGSAPAIEERNPNKVYIPRGKYITGGVLASAAGFGIGHAVQGRYATKGWIFTVTEGTGLYLLSHAKCFRGRNSNSPDREERERGDCENTGEGLLGAGLIIGFRVWEVLDAWLVARPEPETSSPQVLILPKDDGAILSWSVSF